MIYVLHINVLLFIFFLLLLFFIVVSGLEVESEVEKFHSNYIINAFLIIWKLNFASHRRIVGRRRIRGEKMS